ncbi:MAG: glycosyltransferase [Holophaga sp.]|jgi:hypothetical protein
MTFSLLMPSYNQAHFIAEAVDSVLAQDDPDWELWILDNSTDETPQVMAAYHDPRIHFVHEPARMDPGTCLNWMLERARGEHFSYIHTDNRLLPGFVRAHRRALAVHPLALAVCDYWEITEDGRRRKVRKRPDPFPLRRLFSVDTIGVPFAATVELARRLGGFSASDLADDVLFVLRADPLGPRVHIHEPQMEYRVHGGSRFLSSGLGRVQRAIFRSVVQAYGERRGLAGPCPDPFLGGDLRARRHVARAARMAQARAARVLARAGKAGSAWVQGTGPDGFWLAWACFRLGRPVAGFLDGGAGTLLGLPVRPELPPGGTVLAPRSRRGAGESLGWLLRGLPPLDHPLKRLPGDVMCGLLVPYLADGGPVPDPLFLRGDGPMAAYLAYGAETLGGLRVGGILSPDLGGWPPLQALEAPVSAAVWLAPGASGQGRPWPGPGLGVY